MEKDFPIFASRYKQMLVYLTKASIFKLAANFACSDE
jgi:hypothetical protein